MNILSNPRAPFRRRTLVVGTIVAAVILTAVPAAASSNAGDAGGPGPVMVNAVRSVQVAVELQDEATKAASHVKIAGSDVHTELTPQQILWVALASQPRPKHKPQPKPAPAPAPAPKPAPAPAPAPSYSAPSGGVWQRLAQCESGGNWSINTGSFDGGLQFLPSTWLAYGGGQFAPFAYEATPSQQIAVAERVLAATGGSYRASWPACSRKLGL